MILPVRVVGSFILDANDEIIIRVEGGNTLLANACAAMINATPPPSQDRSGPIDWVMENRAGPPLPEPVKPKSPWSFP